jgi:hypothetical protein
MNESEKLLREFDMLRHEHDGLSEMIETTSRKPNHDALTVQRLKKRKLWLKDKIAQLEAIIYPDIIA